MSEYDYRVIFEPLAEGGFQVIVPALPGIVTYGRTIEEARAMAQDAITCHLQGLLKDDEEIPRDPFTSEPPVIEDAKRTDRTDLYFRPPFRTSGIRPVTVTRGPSSPNRPRVLTVPNRNTPSELERSALG